MATTYSFPYISTHSIRFCLILVLVNTNIVTSSESGVTASITTGTQIAEGNFSLSELDKFGHVDGVWGKAIINHEMSQYIDPISVIKGIKGFISTLMWIYNTYKSLTEEPKATLDDVIKQIDSEFRDVKAQLTKIATTLHKLEIYTYRDVDLVVDKSISDITHKTTTDLSTRAINLYDQLFTFMRGILGIHTTSPDLLDTLRNLHDCGSNSIIKSVERFITLVNVGAVGISYYSIAINNKIIFDGEARIQTLNALKDAVLKRTTDVMNTCADMSKSAIEKEINRILGPKQSNSDTTTEVSQTLYKRFDDVYPSNINWIFYTVWNFHPKEIYWPEDPHQTEYMGHTSGLRGLMGVTINGGWTVYWVSHSSGNSAGSTISVDSSKISAIIHEMKDDSRGSGNRRNAATIGRKLEPHIISGRAHVFLLIIGNPKSSATVGEPRSELNVYYHRFHSDLKYVIRGYIQIPYWRTNYFDVVIL